MRYRYNNELDSPLSIEEQLDPINKDKWLRLYFKNIFDDQFSVQLRSLVLQLNIFKTYVDKYRQVYTIRDRYDNVALVSLLPKGKFLIRHSKHFTELESLVEVLNNPTVIAEDKMRAHLRMCREPIQEYYALPQDQYSVIYSNFCIPQSIFGSTFYQGNNPTIQNGTPLIINTGNGLFVHNFVFSPLKRVLTFLQVTNYSFLMAERIFLIVSSGGLHVELKIGDTTTHTFDINGPNIIDLLTTTLQNHLNVNGFSTINMSDRSSNRSAASNTYFTPSLINIDF